MRGIILCLISLVIAGCLAVSQDGSAPLTITTQASQSATPGKKMSLALVAKGGTPPYVWQVVAGALPQGLALDANSGVVSGRPQQPGEYRFTVAVSDPNGQKAQRDFTLTVAASAAPLTIDWKEPPAVHGDAIRGSVVVANHSDQPFDLTVIIVAVNEIDRATALGYQRFTLPPQGDKVIPFGSSPGGGRYIVHADAIAEVDVTDSIYRARKQTDKPLHIQEQ